MTLLSLVHQEMIILSDASINSEKLVRHALSAGTKMAQVILTERVEEEVGFGVLRTVVHYSLSLHYI